MTRKSCKKLEDQMTKSVLLASLNDELKSAGLSMPNHCIFETPSILFRHRKNAFLPNYFSIGPMHHGKKNLVASQKIKIKYLNGLLSRLTTSWWPETMLDEEAKEIKQQKVLTDLINVVESVQEDASACYAGHDFAKELGAEFVKVMVLDGCFIIELFRRNAVQEKDDPIFSISCMMQFLSHDLILLENQIPWFVLETLFEKTKLPSETNSLIELTLKFFASTFSSNPHKIDPGLLSNEVINHILALLRLSLVLPSNVKDEANSGNREPVRSSTRLQEAGVKFKKVEADSILNISFKNGTLEIPSLLIQETTETILRNMIVYEQCLPHCRPIITCNAKLLDNLIDERKDIDILCKNKIFDNWMSPEDASQYFDKLYNDAYVNEFYYSKLCHDLNQHCKHWWPTWRAAYLRHYFTKPWAVAAQIYAVLTFLLSLWQTYIKKG